jgi:hypothetical protein
MKLSLLFIIRFFRGKIKNTSLFLSKSRKEFWLFNISLSSSSFLFLYINSKNCNRWTFFFPSIRTEKSITQTIVTNICMHIFITQNTLRKLIFLKIEKPSINKISINILKKEKQKLSLFYFIIFFASNLSRTIFILEQIVLQISSFYHYQKPI